MQNLEKELEKQTPPNQRTPKDQLIDAIRAQESQKALQLVDKFIAFAMMLGQEGAKKFIDEFLKKFQADRQRQTFAALCISAFELRSGFTDASLDRAWKTASRIADYEPKLEIAIDELTEEKQNESDPSNIV